MRHVAFRADDGALAPTVGTKKVAHDEMLEARIAAGLLATPHVFMRRALHAPIAN